MAKWYVGCAQVKGVSRNSSRESELSFFTYASSYFRNYNNIDSDDDNVVIIIIMIMRTMAIMIQSCVLFFE